MFSPYLRRIVVDILLFVALMLAIFYCRQDFIDFLISLFHFGDKVNLSSVAYIAQRAIMVLIPLIMLATSKSIPKKRIFQIMFFILGICYFLGSTWIFSYLSQNSFSGEAISNLWLSSKPMWFADESVEAAKAAVYDFQYNNAYVFNYINWDSYNLFGVLYSLIMGAFMLRFSWKIHGRSSSVLRRYITIFLIMVLLPLINDVLVEKSFMYSSLWTSKNVLLMFSMFFILLALKLSSFSRDFWNDVF